MVTETSNPAPLKDADAIAFLMADHKIVKALFKDFDELATKDGAGNDKADLVAQICDELLVHGQIEEEIFYPAVREALDDDVLVLEAEVEHATAKALMARLRDMSPGDDSYDALVEVLSEYIDHHVKEEEGEMFPKARKADLDTALLGQHMRARKDELKAELGMMAEAGSRTPKSSDESMRAPKRAS